MVYKYLICDLLSPVSDIVNKNLAITNRSCVSCAHNTSRAFRPNYPEIECVNFLTRVHPLSGSSILFPPLPSSWSSVGAVSSSSGSGQSAADGVW